MPWEKCAKLESKYTTIDQENTHAYSFCNVANFRSGVNVLKFRYKSPVSTLRKKNTHIVFPFFMNGILWNLIGFDCNSKFNYEIHNMFSFVIIIKSKAKCFSFRLEAGFAESNEARWSIRLRLVLEVWR